MKSTSILILVLSVAIVVSGDKTEDVNGATCQNGGQPNPDSHTSCICPLGFGGDDCSSSDSGHGCGGDKHAESHWQTMNVNVEQRGRTCFWHIKAPADNFKVQIKLTKVLATCRKGCKKGMVELKPFKDPTQSGYRECCYNSANINITLTGTNLVPIIATAGDEVFFQLQYRYVYHNETEVPTSVEATPPPRGCYDLNTAKTCSQFTRTEESKKRYCHRTVVNICKPAFEFSNVGFCTISEICRKSCGTCTVGVTDTPVPSTTPSTVPSTTPTKIVTTTLKETCYDVNTRKMCDRPNIHQLCKRRLRLRAKNCLPAEEYPNALWTHGCTIKQICRKTCGACTVGGGK